MKPLPLILRLNEHRLKALGIQNTNPMPGSLDFIQCQNGLIPWPWLYGGGGGITEIQAVHAELELLCTPWRRLSELGDRYFRSRPRDGFDYSFYDQNYRLIDGGILRTKHRRSVWPEMAGCPFLRKTCFISNTYGILSPIGGANMAKTKYHIELSIQNAVCSRKSYVEKGIRTYNYVRKNLFMSEATQPESIDQEAGRDLALQITIQTASTEYAAVVQKRSLP